MSNGSNTRQAVQGVFWTYLAFYSGKFLAFLSTLILARLLTKDDFGVVGYALTTIGFVETFAHLGIGQSVIYYHDDEQNTTDTAFWLGLFIATLALAATWLLAPWIGVFFNDPRAVPVIRALAFSYPIIALGNVHDALLRKSFSFRRKIVPDLTRVLVKGITSISFAAAGFGPWSLIIGQLTGSVFCTIILWFVTPWRPGFRFIPQKSRDFLRFGSHLMAVDILGMILTNSDYLIVGRVLGAAALGAYTLAFKIPELMVAHFCGILSKVIFPIYSRAREDSRVFSSGFLALTRYVPLITAPISIGIALLSRPLVLLAFGEKWLEAAPVLTAISIYTLLISLSYNNGDGYKALGRPEIVTNISIIRASVLIPTLYYAAAQIRSIQAVGWAHVLVASIFSIVDFVIATRIFQIKLKELLQALRPALAGGITMGMGVYFLLRQLGHLSPIFQILAAVPTGAILYAVSIWLVDRRAIHYVIEIVRTFLPGAKKV